ncbi:MAG TPA: hypothetical protein DIS90_12615, partial [Cytophagales bacterium]|nr:hypothetical protein [Cytophagales bacterium]
MATKIRTRMNLVAKVKSLLKVKKIVVKIPSLLGIIIGISFVGNAQSLTEERYASGEKKSSGRVVNGVKTGEWLYYYPSGKRNSVENYKEGVLHGD